MKHRVAVGTDRARVGDRVQLVVGAKLGQRNHVVNMNEPSAQSTVPFLEFQATHNARQGRSE